ncbi:hypothetical protein LMG31884_47730 (plasmid) [Xanthomonas hydrangeae]|uniref:zeta toxin family protein n=1 Tax=Xanthomonas hydrangeae TaxID=2775159 RepID=UPI001964AD69|nr:hypothetical protein LMG31884_47730 [Xanthomonas hydrangeae]CAD7741463.1 hypothetical protein LMG31884_47730 [Xanthomonas hydrangeae]CAD7747878.1 hypothetical protein LMG31887_46100 [Xanthomonas hydrangeae]CAD7747879.1 hypothetical protein LMG31887_46100 [Xanthomonas hydrangeae]CAD7748244.1 hypothetical protein LMG31885_45390 [Xanthomonas hydrangeae]
MSNSRLGDQTVRAIAEQYGELEVFTSEAASNPVAVMLVGQEGAGRHALMNEVEANLNQKGGFVATNAERIRETLPYLGQLQPDQGDITTQTREDVQRISQAVYRQAIEHQRNLIVEGAQSSPEDTLALAKELRAAGYRVEVHAVAVNDQISYARATMMYEHEKAAGRPARYVSQNEHDRGFAEATNTVRRLEYAGAVDRVVIYNRLNDPIIDAAPIAGKPVAGDAFDRARAQLTDYERINLAEKWDAIIEGMERRGASPADNYRVKERAERAHYTLRSSPTAREAYDYQNPTDKHRSEELAIRYGHRLEEAFRQNDTATAARLPELTNAFGQMAMAKQMGNEKGVAEAKFVNALQDRIAMGLRVGAEFKPVSIHDARIEQPRALSNAVEMQR